MNTGIIKYENATVVVELLCCEIIFPHHVPFMIACKGYIGIEKQTLPTWRQILPKCSEKNLQLSKKYCTTQPNECPNNSIRNSNYGGGWGGGNTV